MVKKPAKVKVEKFVKLTDHTCACNDLTSFEYEVHGMTGNRKSFEYAETCMKKFVKSLQVNLFLAGFSRVKPMCSTAVGSSLTKKSMAYNTCGVTAYFNYNKC